MSPREIHILGCRKRVALGTINLNPQIIWPVLIGVGIDTHISVLQYNTAYHLSTPLGSIMSTYGVHSKTPSSVCGLYQHKDQILSTLSLRLNLSMIKSMLNLITTRPNSWHHFFERLSPQIIKMMLDL